MTSPSHSTVVLLLLASLLIGLGHIALLPPFEGFDETAHYSYIQQVAETGRWPRRGDKMSKDIDDYLKAAPTTARMYAEWTYFGFFSAGDGTADAGRRAIKTAPAAPRTFAPGQIENWQAQHPPLYYAVMAPAYLISKGWSLGAQLFFLRALSYLLGWLALCVVIVATLRHHAEGGLKYLPLALAAWPLLFPMWFPEMGRLGNDSLVTVFAACVFLLAWSVMAPVRSGQYALLGAALGLGLLTKATFLPVVAAVLLVLTIQALSARSAQGAFGRRFAGLCITVAVLLAVSGWWYALKLIETGAITGSTEAASLTDTGGLIAGLARNLRVQDLITIPWGFALSFFWGGTWSFIMPPRIWYLPFVVIVAIIGYGVVRTMRRETAQAIDWFPVTAFGLFFAALTYYSFVTLATAHGTSPAWYLHSMAPIMALLVGRGVSGAMRSAPTRIAITALWFYPLLLLLAMTATNLLYFAGCAAKLPDRNYFALTNAIECIGDYPRMIENLGVIASPHSGMALFVSGWILALVAMAMALRAFRTAATD
jgi:Predicted membrane protein (DUF2142)